MTTPVPRPSGALEAVSRRLAHEGSGLLVDLDGTLLNSEQAHQDGLRRYFRQRGWAVDDEVVREFSGRRAVEAFEALAGPWYGEDPLDLTHDVQRLLGALGPPAPVAGAGPLLAACRSRGVPLAVVTSATRAWTAAALGALGIRAGSVAMVTAEDCVRGKPDPEPYRRGAELLGLAPGRLVALDDAPAGVASARAAGIGIVLGVTTGHSAERLVGAGADGTVPDLRGLADAVERRHPPGTLGPDLP